MKEITTNGKLEPQERRTQATPIRRELLQKQKRFRNLKTRIAQAKNPKQNKNNGQTLDGPLAMGVVESDQPQDCQINIRGDAKRLGPTVPRGFLQVVSLESTIPENASGRRELADWLTHPDHPLTSRVIANRVWHHLFGTGIVRTVDNFGFYWLPTFSSRSS